MATSKLRILYSEDDPDNREMTCLILGHKGFEIVCPDSPQDVLRMAREDRFDAFLLDSWMPGMSGVELCERIREFDSHTPIIFYSAAVFPSDKDRAIAAGAQAYITKPSTVNELVNGLRLAINLTAAPLSSISPSGA